VVLSIFVSQAAGIELALQPCSGAATSASNAATGPAGCASATIAAQARRREIFVALSPVLDGDFGHLSLCRSMNADNKPVYTLGIASSNDASGKATIDCDGGTIIQGTVTLKAKYNVTGYVVDATNLLRIQGASVSLTSTDYSSVTDADGSFVLVGVENGTYTLSFSNPGYVPAVQTIVVDEAVTAVGSLSPTLSNPGAVRITLTWGPNADLDGYLTSLECLLSYYSTTCGCGDGIHQTDVTTGYGPETITANHLAECTGASTYVVNTYYVGENSIATVRLYTSAGLAGEWSRSTADFISLGWWHVFSLTFDGGSIDVTTINGVFNTL